MDNASSAFTNLTSQFQHELASQLKLEDVQVQIQAFQFGNNFSLNMVVNIGPLVGLSFSTDEISKINKSLSTHSVSFSSVLFSNYTVVNITAYMPPSPPTGEWHSVCTRVIHCCWMTIFKGIFTISWEMRTGCSIYNFVWLFQFDKADIRSVNVELVCILHDETWLMHVLQLPKVRALRQYLQVPLKVGSHQLQVHLLRTHAGIHGWLV